MAHRSPFTSLDVLVMLEVEAFIHFTAEGKTFHPPPEKAKTTMHVVYKLHNKTFFHKLIFYDWDLILGFIACHEIKFYFQAINLISIYTFLHEKVLL